jgi:hypothetical protein
VGFRVAIVFLLSFAGAYNQSVRGDEAPSKSPEKTSAVDKALRDSLNSDLLDDLPVAPKKKSPAESSPDAKKETKSGKTEGDAAKAKSELDAKLLQQLDEGEDVDLKQPKDPLAQIGMQMRKVEALIQQRDTSRATLEMQKRIASDLDSLIQQLQQQNQSSSSNKSSSSGQQSEKSGTGNTKASQKPANESTKRVEKATVQSDNSAELQKLIKEIWGHLPARMREQMQNVSEEQFLPQYERLLEEYYRRLAEEGAKSP